MLTLLPLAVGPCDSDPCVNGDCIDNGDSTYSCDCDPGFTGTNCDSTIGEQVSWVIRTT